MTIAGGSQLAGYRVVSLLGRGGAGAVYLADDLRLGRKVALKVLNAETADAPGMRERFVAESRIAASLDHPHIIPIYEAGEAEGQLFIAMRYVPGADLASAISSGSLTTERTVRVLGQVASALDAAHEAGLIHRDVKPANILLAQGIEPGSDHAYLTDFGLTKQVSYAGSDPRATKSGQLLGTIGYIAPEQIQGLPIDGRVDVYSLGCVLYECLARRAPYPRDSDLAVLLAHVEAPPPSLAAVGPELPPAIDAVVAKALAKDPDARYPTSGDLARAAADALAPSASRVSAITRGFLFSDLRGYTDFVDAHGDRAAADLLGVYRRLVRDVVRRHGGAEIKTEGDSFYVVFPSASSAVGCGLAIAAAAETATREEPGRPIRVAIGIQAGESTRTEDGYVGLAVNTAARICAQAQSGEVLVSDTVRSIAGSSHDFSFTARGRRELKGIAEPVRLFAVNSAGPAVLGAGANRQHKRLGFDFGRSRSSRLALALGGSLALVGLAIAGSQLLVSAPGALPSVRELAIVGDSPLPVAAGVPLATRSFRPRLQFTPPDAGWYARADEPDAFLLVAEHPGADLFHPEEDVLVANVQLALDGPCEYSTTRFLERTPDALIRHLQASPYLAVSALRPRFVGGYAGVSADVAVKKKPVDVCTYPDFPAKNTAVFLFPTGSAASVDALRPESMIRVITVDVQGIQVTFIVEWNKNTPSFQTRADGLLDSIRFTP